MKMAQKYYLTSVFVLLLILPILNGVFGIVKFERVSENRVFADSLEIDVNHLDEFPEKADAYVNDNFPFRSPLLTAYHRLKYHVFQASPHPEKTILGRDGWYFMAGREKEIYEGKKSFTDDTLQLIVDEWKERKKYFDQKGIKVYWMIAPLKHYVYEEYLPFNVQPGEQRRITALQELIEQNIPKLIIDPLKTLRENKQRRMYYKQDNHWTFRAGEVVTELFLKRLSKDLDQFSYSERAVSWADSMVYDGIHHKVIGIDSNGELREWPMIAGQKASEVHKYGFPPVEGFPYPWEHERRFVNEAANNNLRVLIIRDSFGEHVMPFLSEYFSESVFIFDNWQYGLNPDIVEEVQPDVVLYLSIEQNAESFIKRK